MSFEVGRRWRLAGRRPAEVLQTSAMDCGPAALAAGCRALGLEVGLDALRAACGADVDGTSVDAMEQVANGLGLNAEQVVVPWETSVASAETRFPALVVTTLPDGFTHLVLVLERRGDRLLVMDPAVGWRKVRLRDFTDEVYRHPFVADADDVEGYVCGDEFRETLRARLDALGTDHDPDGFEDILRTDAAVSTVESLLRRRVVRRRQATRLVRELAGEPEVVADAYAASARTHGPDGDMRTLYGAVMIQLATGPMTPAPEFAHILERRTEPVGLLREVASTSRVWWWTAAASALAFGALLMVAFFAAAPVLEARSSHRELLWLGAAVAGSLVFGALSVVTSTVAARRAEGELRRRILGRAALLGDGYSRTRPLGDLAERGHALQHLGLLAELVRVAGLRLGQVGAACIGLSILVPWGWLWALVLPLTTAVGLALVPRLVAEPDVRARSTRGVLAQLSFDLLGSAPALRRLGGIPNATALGDELVESWRGAMGRVVHRIGAIGVGGGVLSALLGAGLALTAGLDAEHAPQTLAGVVIISIASTASVDLVLLVRRALTVRSTLVRIADPLLAPVPDAPTPVAPTRRTMSGVALSLSSVTCVLGGRAVLDGVSLDISAGEHVAVVGPSGAGKSSLIMLIAGWLTPTEGRILVDGRRASAEVVAALRAETAWVDPTTGPNVDLTNASSGEVQIARLDRAHTRPGARLVLLDEAITGLDPSRRADALARARSVWERSTLIYVTHTIAEALTFPRVLVIDAGRVVADGSPTSLLAEREGALAGLLLAEQTIAEQRSSSGSWREVQIAEVER